MDFTEQYLLMLKESQEIQSQWEPSLGDFYINYINQIWTIEHIDFASYRGKIKLTWRENWKETCKLIWIPKQDQLQQIYANSSSLDKASNWYIVVLDNFQDWVLNKEYQNDDYILQFTSLEQLWLAFVMLMVYDKVWNNETKKWIEV